MVTFCKSIEASFLLTIFHVSHVRMIRPQIIDSDILDLYKLKLSARVNGLN